MIQSYNGQRPQISNSAFISEAAYIIGGVEIGENSSVWHGAVIRGDLAGTEIYNRVRRDIKIGNNTHIEDNVLLHGTEIIGDNVIIGHGAVVEALKIGDGVLIGNNATVLTDVQIGDCCVIAAGAVVMEGMHIPSHSFVTGVPAKIKGEVSREHMAKMENMRQALASLAQAHKQQEAHEG